MILSEEIIGFGLAGLLALVAGLLMLQLYVLKRRFVDENNALSAINQLQSTQLAEQATSLALAHSAQQHWQQLAEQRQLDWQQAQQALSATQVALGKVQTQLEEKQQQFEQQHALLKREFSQLAQDIIEQKTRSFKEQSELSLTQLLTPLHHDVKDFKQKVEQIQQSETEQRLALKVELQHLQKLNVNLSDQAHQLTQALQGQKKAQGNWGEMILERVLESAGLVAQRDYAREVSFNSEQGRQRPDVIIYLPGEKHLVVDAKTSLAAYSRFVNTEDETERQQALKDHVTALRERMKELSERDYFKLPGLVSPEVVILFVPIESAYVEAIKADDKLLDDAMKMQLLIATPSTLLSSVQIVRQLWRFAEQNKHSAELARRAELFYNKLQSFITSLQAVGNQLDRAKDSYEKAFGQLYSGRANLIKQASEFKDLGVMVQKELPQDLVERAQLELIEDLAPSHENK